MGKKFTITQNPEYGRYMIASQDISPGEIILDELPLISGPVLPFPGNFINHHPHPHQPSYDSPTSKVQYDPSSHIPTVCPVCCRIFNSQEETDTSITRCTKCSLLFCSSDCAGNTSHSSRECLVLQKLPELGATPHGYYPVSSSSVMYQFINVIRGVFLRLKSSQEEGNEWTQMSQLQAKVEELDKAGVFSPYDSLFQLLRWEFFLENSSSTNSSQSDTKIPGESIESIARQCLGIMRTNAFSSITNQVSREGLYFLSSLMAHSCLPNTDRQFDPNGLKMITRAAVPIPKGEAITTSYLSLMNGTHERYIETTKTWLFTCRCSRCEDPQELGTFMSTVACPKCTKLSLRPHVKESSESRLKWKCTQCSSTFVSPSSSSSSSGSANNPFFPESLRIVEDAKGKIDMKKAEGIECLEKWLDTYDNGNFIHTNHSTFAQVKLYLCQYYGREKELGELEHKRLLRKASYCLQMSKIMAIVFKGFFLLKGVVLFELWCSLKEIKRRVDQAASTMSMPELDLIWPQSNNVQINYSTDEINRVKAESLRILQYAMENSSEESMAQIMLSDDD